MKFWNFLQEYITYEYWDDKWNNFKKNIINFLVKILSYKSRNLKLEQYKKYIKKQLEMNLNPEKFLNIKLLDYISRFQHNLKIEDIKWRKLGNDMTKIMQEIMELTDFDEISFYIKDWNFFSKKTIKKTWEVEFNPKFLPNKNDYRNLCELTNWNYYFTKNWLKISSKPIEGIGEDFSIEVSPGIFMTGDKYNEAKEVEKQIPIFDSIAFAISSIIKNLEIMDDLYKDELTKVYSRKYRERIEYKKWYLLALDIDHFKMVNDNYGHSNWDIVLREIAQVVNKSLRIEDKVYSQRTECDEWGKVHRTGGEEFIVYIDVDNEIQALIVANRILDNVRKKIIHLDNGKKISKTVSIWISQIKWNKNKAVKMADNALYQAKNNWRDQIVVYQD